MQPEIVQGRTGLLEQRTSINTLCRAHKRRALHEKISCFFSKIFLKLHLKRESNPQMHTNRAIFSRVLFVYFQKRQTKTKSLSLKKRDRNKLEIVKKLSINYKFSKRQTKLGYFLSIFKKDRGNLPPSPFLVAHLFSEKRLIQH